MDYPELIREPVNRGPRMISFKTVESQPDTMWLNGKTIAITGAGGFIGLRTVERCRALGMRVKGLDRSREAAAAASRAGARMTVGDVRDPRAVRWLVHDADVVFHTAALVREDGAPKMFADINVGGTRVVNRIAADARVPRLIHLSSVMVYGFDFPDQVDEHAELRAQGNPYCQSKIDSERLVAEFHGRHGMETTIIRSGDVYGPGSVPWTLRPMELMKRGLFMLPDGGRGIMNHVYVDNLLDAVLQVIKRDVTGDVFNITDGASTTYREFFSHYARMLGINRLKSAPGWILGPAVHLLSGLSRLIDRAPAVTPESLRFLRRKNSYSTEKARYVLGFAPRIDLTEGMNMIDHAIRGNDRMHRRAA